MRWLAFLALAFLTSGAVACDSGPPTTPASTFPDPAPSSSDILGHVRAGTEPVAGALVRVDPSAAFPADPRWLAAAATDPRLGRTTTTDPAGAFRFQFAPFVYDLSLSHDRDLYVFRELVERVFDPPLAVDAPVTGFMARVVPATSPPARPGNATAYFVSGADARSIVAATSAGGAFDATFRNFDSTITLHAVEYVAAVGLAGAVAEGKLDVGVRDGVVVTPIVAMTLITLTGTSTFDAMPPAGYALEPITMEMDYGLRTSAVPLPLTHVVPGQPLTLSVATDARYFVRGRATKGGAVSDSGRFYINPFGRNALVLPPPVSTEAPIDDTAVPMDEGTPPPPADLAPGGTLAVRLTTGILEHALVPETGNGTTIHVVTGDRETPLPDATALGLAPPTGRYRWTVQSFPTLSFTDRLTGEDARVNPPSWTSPPRVIVLR